MKLNGKEITVIPVRLTADDYNYAKKISDNSANKKRNHNNSYHTPDALIPGRDIIGFLGEIAVKKHLGLSTSLDCGHFDEWDIVIDDFKIDVKTTKHYDNLEKFLVYKCNKNNYGGKFNNSTKYDDGHCVFCSCDLYNDKSSTIYIWGYLKVEDIKRYCEILDWQTTNKFKTDGWDWQSWIIQRIKTMR